jgi:hypothetical protein
LLHLGVEVDIDRESNKYINMSIFRFDIEDTQKDVHIAPPFRVSLISPNFLLFIVDFHFSIYLA